MPSWGPPQVYTHGEEPASPSSHSRWEGDAESRRCNTHQPRIFQGHAGSLRFSTHAAFTSGSRDSSPVLALLPVHEILPAPPPPAPNAGFTDCTSVRRTGGQARLRHLPSSSSSPQACRLEGSERLSSSSFAPNKGPFGARQTQIKEVIAFIQKSLCVLVK